MEYTYKTDLVHGIPFPPGIDQQRMDDLKSIPLRSDDLFVVTYPKSGTTWAQQIVKLIRNGGKDDDTKVVDAVPWLEEEGLVLASGTKVADMPSPRSFKSHTPYHMMPGGPPHAAPAKYIYIARNPKDVAVSLFYHSRAFKAFEYSGPWDHFYRLFMDAKAESGDWFDHILEWWKHKDDPNVLFLKFEDMKKDSPLVVRAIAEFIRIDLKPEVIATIAEQSSFAKMKSNSAANYSWRAHVRNPSEEAFMRKGIVGDWRNHFTAEQNAEFDAVYSERMKDSGLEFDFD